MGLLFVVIIVIVVFVIYKGRSNTTAKSTSESAPISSSSWAPPSKFDDKVRFFTKVAAGIGEIHSEGAEIFVGVDEIESGSKCFIAMTLFDVEGIAHAKSLFQLIKLPEEAIRWILNYSENEDKDYYIYKETVQQKYPTGYFEKIIRQTYPTAKFTNQLGPNSAGSIARFP